MGQHRIAVEIDHSRLIPVLAVEPGGHGELDLTTITANQRRAVIRLFLISGDSSQLLSTFEVDNLTSYGVSRPNMRLHASISRRRLTVAVDIGGRTVLRCREDLSQWIPADRRGWWIAAAAVLLLLVGAGGFLLIRTVTVGGRDAGAMPAPPVPTAQEPVEHAPRAAIPRETAPSSPAPASPSSPAPAPPIVAPEVSTPETGEAAPAFAREQRSVYFHPDSAELTPSAQAELRRIAGWLDELDRQRIVVRIEGHCAPAGSEQGRLELSRQRARAVDRFLRETGWQPPDTIQVSGFSSDRPATTDPTQQHLNRRAEVIVEPRG